MASTVSGGGKVTAESEKLVDKWRKRALAAEGALQHITNRLEEVKRKVEQVIQ